MFFTAGAKLTYFLGDFYPYLILMIVSTLAFFLLLVKIYKLKIDIAKKKLIIILLSTLLVFIIIYSFFEAYFRYVYDQSDGLGFLNVNERWNKRHVVYNSYFFRDRDFDGVKKEGVVRIGVLGDSIAFGGGIENVEDRFSNILEKKLRGAGFNVEVYNLGAPGYDTDGEIQNYQTVKNLDFDIVIWEYFLNDIQTLGKSTGTKIIDSNSAQGNITSYISDKSFFFDFLYWRFSSKYNKTFGELRKADLERYKDDDQLKNHKQQIADFLGSLKQDNKKVVVIIFPFLYFLDQDYPAVDIHQIMSSHFRENGAEVIDMLDYLGGKRGRDLWASEFDSHPNEYVHRLAAEKLFGKVVPLLR